MNVVLSQVWAKGGEGGEALAKEVLNLCENAENNFKFVYPLDMTIREKIEAIAKTVYRADGVVYEMNAKKQLKRLEELGFDNLPICMAKTQFSFSDNKNLLGAPRGFEITITSIKADAGAGFIVANAGSIMTMPGLPKVPAAEKIDVDNTGRITGLF